MGISDLKSFASSEPCLDSLNASALLAGWVNPVNFIWLELMLDGFLPREIFFASYILLMLIEPEFLIVARCSLSSIVWCATGCFMALNADFEW